MTQAAPATVSILTWNHGEIGGFTAAVKINGTRFKVPGKMVPSAAGWGRCNFDSKIEATRHARAFAFKKLAELGLTVATEA